MLIEDLYRAPWHERMIGVIQDMVDGVIKDDERMVQEIKEWQSSEQRANMIVGERYYLNKTDILTEKKQPIDWKSNRKLSHGFAKKLVDQKIGYLLSKQPTFATDDIQYGETIQDIFSRGLLKKVKNVGKEAINKGIAYLYPHINAEGELAFVKFPSEQIIPFWENSEHLKMLAFLRVYDITKWVGLKKEKETKVEYYHSSGIDYYILKNDKLIPDNLAGIDANHHLLINGKPFLWERIPLIHFKYNEEEQPLIDSIKSLVDNHNWQASTNADLLADIPNFIYKLVNYGGQDLGEFTDQLQTYRVVAVETGGDVDKLQADINTEAVEKELERTRDSIYEFGRGVDTKGDDLGVASGVAIKHRYGDLDMDCNILEAEFQASIQQMIWFIDRYLLLTKKGDYTNVDIEIIFNRDIVIAETEAIDNASKSIGILDDQTIRENHPWYTEAVEERLEKQEAELKKEIEGYRETFPGEDVKSDG